MQYAWRKKFLSLTEVAGEATLRSYLRKGVDCMLENILLVTRHLDLDLDS